MTELWLIGIGTGNPDHLTRAGQRAIAEADLILVPRKGAGKEDLADLRVQIVAELRADAPVAEFDLPVRDPSLPYLDRVARWHDAIAAIWTDTIRAAGSPAKVALLVWGDPSLYDSTLRIAARLQPGPRLRAVPGITSLQALTAAHAIPLNTVGGAVVLTTGRRLRESGWPEGAETVAVMLDSGGAFEALDGARYDIWWGAYLGMENELLRAGRLCDISQDILDTRARARDAHGWIMDIYILRVRSD